MQNNDFLSEEYTIDTPENVTFGYEVVDIGSRFIATVIDTLILIAVILVLGIVTLIVLAIVSDVSAGLESLFSGQASEWITGVIAAVALIVYFGIFWGYYIFFELLWNGQTPGKRVAKIRVVRTDGNPVGFLQSAIRNLVRFVDFLPTGYGIGLITMFFNKNSRRLGDFAAGTIVIRDMGEVRLDDLVGGSAALDSTRNLAPRKESGDGPAQPTISATMAAPTLDTDPLLAKFTNIRTISMSDYELITDTVARHNANGVPDSVISRLATAIATKLNMDAPSYGSRANTKFLEEVAEAYRRFN